MTFSLGAGSKHLDLNAEGTVNGVGIYEFDMESVEEKPWRKPG
jgi:pre-mRNA 3'-end-processing factor FIP1